MPDTQRGGDPPPPHACPTAGVVITDTGKSHFHCPSVPYWLVATALVPVTAVLLLVVRRHLMAKWKRRHASGYEAVEGDIHWDSKTTLLYPALCTGAGICAGMFGVGGGIVKVRGQLAWLLVCLAVRGDRGWGGGWGAAGLRCMRCWSPLLLTWLPLASRCAGAPDAGDGGAPRGCRRHQHHGDLGTLRIHACRTPLDPPPTHSQQQPIPLPLQMILFTAASACVVFISFGQLQFDYGVMFFCLGVVLTAIGQAVVMWLSARLRSRALIVFCMATLLSLSSVVLAAQGGYLSLHDARAHTLWHFGNLCGHKS